MKCIRIVPAASGRHPFLPPAMVQPQGPWIFPIKRRLVAGWIWKRKISWKRRWTKINISHRDLNSHKRSVPGILGTQNKNTFKNPILFGIIYSKIIPFIHLDKHLDKAEHEALCLWTKFLNDYSIALQMKAFGKKEIKPHAGV